MPTLPIVIYSTRENDMGSTKYLGSMGTLSRKDNTLYFKKADKGIHIPVENVKEIYCFNEVSLNTKLLDFLSRNNVTIQSLSNKNEITIT